MLCNCPLGAEIADIPTDDCLERLGQIQKIIIQRTKSGGTVNKIVIATTNPNLEATWTALLAASDSTKVQVSPYIADVSTEDGGPREFGSGNQVQGGIPLTLGRNPSPFTAMMYDIKQTIISAMKTYECEKELSIFFINEAGAIIGKTDTPATPDTFYGFPIRSFFISDKMPGGYDEPDKNSLRFSFLPNWSDGLHIVTPSDFDALSDLS